MLISGTEKDDTHQRVFRRFLVSLAFLSALKSDTTLICFYQLLFASVLYPAAASECGNAKR